MLNKFFSFSFLSFSASKGIIFLAPLLILWLEGREYYVVTEQVIAIALLSWPVLAFGMTALYPYFTIEKKNSRFNYYFYKHLFIATTALLIAYLVAMLMTTNDIKIQMAVLMVIFMLFSYFFSITYKCKSDVKTSSIFDALPYLLIFIFTLLWTRESVYGNLFSIMAVLLITIIVLGKYNKHKKVQYKSDEQRETFMFFYEKSFFSFLVSWIAIAIVMLPRAFIPEILSSEQSESVYLALRSATILVLIYQFLQISYYPKLFHISKNAFFKLWSFFWLGGAIACLASFEIFKSKIVVWAVLYTFFWIIISFMEMQVIRHSVQKKVLFVSLLVSPMLFVLAFLENFHQLAITSIMFLTLYAYIQMWSIFGGTYSLKAFSIPVFFSVLLGFIYV